MIMPDFDVEELVHETDAAWLLLIHGEEIWLPKSQCQYGDDGIVTVPEWLAKAKGLT